MPKTRDKARRVRHNLEKRASQTITGSVGVPAGISILKRAAGLCAFFCLIERRLLTPGGVWELPTAETREVARSTRPYQRHMGLGVKPY